MKFFLVISFLISNSSFAAPEFWNTIEEQLEYTQTVTENYDESVNYQPGLNLYNEASTLTDLYGTNGSQLCAPIAITHVMNFLKYYRTPNFSQLSTIPDMDNDGTADTYKDQIRYFFALCATDREIGTRYHQTIGCVKTFISYSIYTPWAYIIGPHSPEAPAGHDISSVRRAITTNDIRYYVGNQAGVLMGIGWYKLNQAGQYERSGGHFINLYGYDFAGSWGNDKIILKVVNSWMNYTGRDRSQMYDDVVMNRVSGPEYPHQVEYELSGPGFNFKDKALVEDIFIMIPAPATN